MIDIVTPKLEEVGAEDVPKMDVSKILDRRIP